jgi:hypothetical protein
LSSPDIGHLPRSASFRRSRDRGPSFSPQLLDPEKDLLKKSLLLISSLVFALLGACATAYAQPPVQDVPRHPHPSLASSQNAIRRALDQIIATQQARQGGLGGHAVPAKASVELSLADLNAGLR